MNIITRSIIPIALAATLAVFSAGCQEPGPAEKLGESLDDAVNEVEDAVDDLSDELEHAGDDLRNSLEDGLDEVEDAAEEVK